MHASSNTCNRYPRVNPPNTFLFPLDNVLMTLYHNPMHKDELIKYLVKRNRRAPGGRTQVFYREALQELLEGIQYHLAQGKEITFLGFGTFYTRMHKGGKGRNFKTGKVVEYKPVRLVAFRPGALLKQAVRRKKK